MVETTKEDLERMLKRTLACMLVVFLCVLGVLALLQPAKQSVAEEKEETFYNLEGFIISVQEDGYLLQTADGQQLLVHYDMTSAETRQPGDAVRFSYDGMMSRSIPPQVTASQLLSRKVTGMVEAVSEDEKCFSLHTEDGELISVSLENVLLPENISYAIGETVTAFLDSKDETALHVRREPVRGVILGVEDNQLELETENGTVLVQLTEQTLQLVSPEAGLAVCVVPDETMLLSDPAVYSALELYSAD